MEAAACSGVSSQTSYPEREGPTATGAVGMKLEGSSDQVVSGPGNGAEKLGSVRQKGVAKGFKQAAI